MARISRLVNVAEGAELGYVQCKFKGFAGTTGRQARPEARRSPYTYI